MIHHKVIEVHVSCDGPPVEIRVLLQHLLILLMYLAPEGLLESDYIFDLTYVINEFYRSGTHF